LNKNKKEKEETGQQHEVPDVTGRVIFHEKLIVTYTRQAHEATDSSGHVDICTTGS
jgi:hypothetical protein